MVAALRVLGLVAVTAIVACDQQSRGGLSRFQATGPTPTPVPAPVPPPTPAPLPGPPGPPLTFAPFEITTIAVGDVITRTSLAAPECRDEPGWPCIYFRLTAPRDGTLEANLSYAAGTQGNQWVDLSLRESAGPPIVH